MRTNPVGLGPYSIRGRAQAQAIPRGLAALALNTTTNLLTAQIPTPESVLGHRVGADYGDGHVILLGMRPQWRGQPFGNFRIVFNAALYGREVAAAAPANPDFWQAPEEKDDEGSTEGGR